MERVLRMHNDREASVGGNDVMDRCSPDFNRWGLSRKVGEKLVFRPACIYQGEEWKRRFCEKKKERNRNRSLRCYNEFTNHSLYA